MKRLTHSDKGFLRGLQISGVQLFIFVEGGLDRPFVARLVDAAFPKKTWKHQVIAIKEFPHATGGKPALLKLFSYLRREKKLAHVAFNKKKVVCLFIADKDIDDLTNTKVRSSHFLYTDTYDLEGHLFKWGNLHSAVADTCQITPQQALNLIGDPNAWIRRHVENWIDWVALCILAHKAQANLGCGFKRPSNINSGYLAATDTAALGAHEFSLQQALQMSQAEFRRLFLRHKKRIKNSVDAGEPLLYFKGKWLQLILEKYLENGPSIPDSNFNGAGERVVSALVAQVATKEPCSLSAGFIGKIQGLASSLP